ncbi:lantibiotic dehydratase [Sphingobacterium sp. N143]|uniref:lantibiotic dehydratase n=1 Tax=Sphingobacterium sp. N143 TaxID=2746727 RepID=UPI00257580C8|nr:lantibiotic dehydratase [Sphingobacterium sp. N143]MDM1295616.1 lantibiotic dehydratase [Sphingobacterium sp. N143]
MYKSLGKAVVRKPLYEYSTLFSPSGDSRALNELVTEKLEDPCFLEGIYWTSRDLYNQIYRFKNGELIKEKKERLFTTLQKYIIRAATRCTPYGVFAGCSLVNIGDQHSNIKQHIVKRARIDMGVLYQIVQTIALHEDLVEQFSYQINNSIYKLAQTYRYIETLWIEGKIEYQTTSIDRSELLDEIFDKFKKNVRLQTCDFYKIIGDDVTYDDKKDFLLNLIESQFVTSELSTVLTSADPLETITKILRATEPDISEKVSIYLHVIHKIAQVLSSINQSKLGGSPFQQIEECLYELQGIGIEVKQGQLFHIDLWNPITEADYVPNAYLKDIQQASAILARTTANSSLHETQLRNFKQLFVEKYGDREIPLTEALDQEQGIGFPAQNKLGNISHNEIAEYISGGSKNRLLSPEKRADPFELWLRKKVFKAQEESTVEIEINKYDVAQFPDQSEKLASELSVMGTILPSGKLLLENFGGANGFALLGRFSYMNTDLEKWCKSEIAKPQIHEDIIYAEIVHLPEGRTANIARPTGLLAYQIPYLAYVAQDDTTVLISNILLSIQDEELILRCKESGRRIIPVLANAYNYLRSDLPIYRFLAAIQHQGRPGLSIQLGDWANWYRFIPRIRTGNVILQRAKWNILEDDINTIMNSEEPLIVLKGLLKKWRVVARVSIQDGDNELVIDTQKEDYLMLLIQEMKGRKRLVLVECLFDSDHLATQKVYIKQFILPLRRAENKVRNISAPLRSDIQYSFALGSEWMYYKLYCGAFISDDLLLQVVKPMIALLKEEKVIDQAFFIRYSDPHYHIRLRFHVIKKDLVTNMVTIMALMDKLVKQYIEDGSVWKLQLDTYQREIERYGISHIKNTEQAFSVDSEVFLWTLEDERFREDNQYRFAMGLRNIDNWLSLFYMSLEAKVAFCSQMANAFALEHDKESAYQVDQLYRSLIGKNVMMLNRSIQPTLPLDQRLEKLGALNLPQENLASYIHMSINRWYKSDQRLMEYISYRFLEKEYKKALSQRIK